MVALSFYINARETSLRKMRISKPLHEFDIHLYKFQQVHDSFSANYLAKEKQKKIIIESVPYICYVSIKRMTHHIPSYITSLTVMY